jgi:SAM-dependent methyltransferase
MWRAEDGHWWYGGMTAIAADWLRRLPTGRTGFVLDAGCGTGGNLGWLPQFGRVCGVDVHPLALRLAAGRGCRWLVRADVQALPFGSGQFDLATCFDVLYHAQVASDWEALRELARVLRPGGWLLLRVPAYNWLRGRHDRVVHTRRRYTAAELTLKLESARLRPVRVSYANTLLFPVAVLWRLLARGEAASDLRAWPGGLNRWLELCLRAEAVWLRRWRLPFGLSLLALARKESE